MYNYIYTYIYIYVCVYEIASRTDPRPWAPPSLRSSLYFFFISLEPRAEWYTSL